MISIVVLAGGKSTRFHRNKMLERLDSMSIIQSVVQVALQSKADEVVVVLGHEAERIKEELKNFDCRIILNERYEEGQSSSVKAGVAAISHEAEAVLILPGDVAFIRPDLIDVVIKKFEESKAPVVVAAYKGEPGHPILFHNTLFQEILRISEAGAGLKEVVERHTHEIKTVETGAEEVTIDIDTQEDFSKCRKFQRI